jgi:hypothetical protein
VFDKIFLCQTVTNGTPMEVLVGSRISRIWSFFSSPSMLL